jgi:hypothetical protein
MPSDFAGEHLGMEEMVELLLELLNSMMEQFIRLFAIISTLFDSQVHLFIE